MAVVVDKDPYHKHDQDHDPSHAASSHSDEAFPAPPKLLCALCDGSLDSDFEFGSLEHVLSSCPTLLYMYIPQADPKRREFARLLNAMFTSSVPTQGRIIVVPSETFLDRWADASVDMVDAKARATEETSIVYLPRPVRSGVYVSILTLSRMRLARLGEIDSEY